MSCVMKSNRFEKNSLRIDTYAQAIEKLRSFHNKYNKILKANKERRDQPSYYSSKAY